jgi:hypothetical protein
MAQIPCTDFYDEAPLTVPARIKRTNPDAIKDRWANFIYSMDLSPEQGDEDVGNQYGAWSLWDLPVSHCTQIDDDNGDDLIVVAILDRLYVLDWTAYRDEYEPDKYAPIYKSLRLGPLPSSADDVAGGRGGFQLDTVKRFREFEWSARYPSTAEDGQSKWRVSIAEWENEDATRRITIRRGSQRMRVQCALRGTAFVVTLEHAANERVEITNWKATWDETGRPWRESRRVQ